MTRIATTVDGPLSSRPEPGAVPTGVTLKKAVSVCVYAAAENDVWRDRFVPDP
jgi:hypothetical protein